MENTGMASFEDVRLGSSSSWTVAPGQVEELAGILRQACPFDTGGRPSSECADCFFYDLDIATGADRFSWTGDESPAEGAMQALVRYLVGLQPLDS